MLVLLNRRSPTQRRSKMYQIYVRDKRHAEWFKYHRPYFLRQTAQELIDYLQACDIAEGVCNWEYRIEEVL